MEAIDVYKKVLENFENETWKWHTGSDSTDKSGVAVNENDPKAYHLCLLAAIGKVLNIRWCDVGLKYTAPIANQINQNIDRYTNVTEEGCEDYFAMKDVWRWNDQFTRTKEEVLDLLRRTIRSLEDAS